MAELPEPAGRLSEPPDWRDRRASDDTRRMSEPTVDRIADLLWDAERSRTPIPPVGDELRAAASEHDLTTLAYAIQQKNVARRVAEHGARVCGRKIGLTSEAVQRQLGVDSPDFGALYSDRAYGSGETVPFGLLHQPRIEAEVALVLGADLDRRRHTVADVISATAYALPALEIVGSRIAGWKITFADTVADNASGDRFVLGTVPVPLASIDLARIEMSMTVDGDEASTGAGVACLGNPLFAARWLADTMVDVGTPLRAGDVVLTGALGPMVDLRPGMSVVADLGALGRVGVNIGGEATS